MTFVLQKLRGRAPGFDEWYAAEQANLKADPIARWFVELRNRIEKEGTHGAATTGVHIKHLSFADMSKYAPPNARSMFLGDQLGRSGWIIELEDGSEATVYFTIPPSVGRATLSIEDAPEGRTMEELLPLWLDQLEDVLIGAETRFGGASN